MKAKSRARLGRRFRRDTIPPYGRVLERAGAILIDELRKAR